MSVQNNPPVCSCSHDGQPFLLNGVMVVSRDPSCRVHSTTLSKQTQPASVERVVANWNGREKEE